MCGLIGCFTYGKKQSVLDKSRFIAARDVMETRGPDAAGFWTSDDSQIALGHRRLTIIDLDETANQPLHLDSAPLSIIYNGEIYNFKELRTELEARGCRFRTHSDTEVILRLYEQEGPKCVERLRGMFAFAIWDARDQSLFLARDPLGIKPLYYLDDGQQLVAASQVRAIRAMCDDLTPDPAGHLGFFLNGYVPDPFTMFKEIRALPAGCWLRRTKSDSRLYRYYSVQQVAAEAVDQSHKVASDEERKRQIEEALRSSIKAHMIADVEVGLFLSAGVDSTAIGWLAADQATDQLRAITLGAKLYRGSHSDEIPLAREFAATFNLHHKATYLEESDFSNQISNIIASMDQPSIDGVNTYFVSKLAADAGLKVMLSGLGGDELFRGYPSFRSVPQIVNLNRRLPNLPWAGRLARTLSAPVLKQWTSPKYASLFEYGGSYAKAYFLRRALYMPWELRGIKGGAALLESWDELAAEIFSDADLDEITDPEAKVTVMEITRYMRSQLLRDSDWAGMAFSLEIRVPFVDSELLGQLAPFIFNTQGVRKSQILDAINYPMKEQLANRPKTGFSLPIRDWMIASANMKDRGLRGWSKHVYQHWCRENNCPQLVQV